MILDNAELEFYKYEGDVAGLLDAVRGVGLSWVDKRGVWGGGGGGICGGGLDRVRGGRLLRSFLGAARPGSVLGGRRAIAGCQQPEARGWASFERPWC